MAHRRYRISATLGMTRGDMTAQRSAYGLSNTGTNSIPIGTAAGSGAILRCGGGPSGIPGTVLVGGNLSPDSNSPSINPAIP